MKWFLRILASIVVIVIGILIYVTYLFYAPSPQYNGDAHLKGLSEKVKVVHDDFAIPHIYAANEEDAYLALGYLHAQERLWQMDLMRRVGGGMLSEILGEDLIEIDKLFRTLGINEKAKEAVANGFKDNQNNSVKLANKYIEGINYFIEHGATPVEYKILQIEKKKFEPIDLYRTVGYMSFSFALALREDPLLNKIYENIGADYYRDLGVTTELSATMIRSDKHADSIQNDSLRSNLLGCLKDLPVPLFTGSNSWVLAPKKSASGQVLFCNDAHIEYAQPSVWWEAHIECPDFSFYGNHLAGFPFALIGHTKHHAWGLTMFQNDDMDFYQEIIEGDEYIFKDEKRPLKKRNEKIIVKGEKQPVEFTVYATHHGPIVSDVNDLLPQNVSMYWSFNDLPNNALSVTYGLSHASSLKDFEERISVHNAPGLNFMYGDAEGNIAWWATAALVKRPKHVDSKRLLDGSSGKDEILGYYDFDENPHSINPETGYVYSANNQPSGEYDGKLYPGYYYWGARGKRIMEFLDQEKKFTTTDMKNMLLDDVGLFHIRNVKELFSLIEPKSKSEEKYYEMMTAWNGSHKQEMEEPTFYYAFQYNLLKYAMHDELGEDDFEAYLKTYAYMRTYHVLSHNDSSKWWPNATDELNVNSRAALVNEAFTATVNQMENESKRAWKDHFTLEHPHALGKVEALAKIFNVGPLPLDGGIEVLNKQGFVPNAQLQFKCKTGPSKRIVIDFANIENAESINPTGQSGHVVSQHYSDQFEMHVNGRFRPMLMDSDKIIKFDRVLFLNPVN
ncbi:MAG: penicillin acylase family protein [Bacteroidia bacterium]